MSYGAGIVGKAIEIAGTMPTWFWWGSLGFTVVYLGWNLAWRKMGPDAKPLFATLTLMLIVFAGLSGLVVFLVHLWQST